MSELDQALASAARLFDEIRDRTRDGRGVTRDPYGRGEQAAHDIVRAHLARLGLAAKTDAALNLSATLPGHDRSLPAVVIGSHLDSVPNGGNYDGLAGVLAGLACLEDLRLEGKVLRRGLKLLALRGEENAWFGAQHVGSRAALGRLSPEALQATRIDTGRTLADHMAEAGADLEPITAGVPLVDAGSIHCFLECHIEQADRLIEADVPVGIVTGIRGVRRCRQARCLGRYDHAGSAPRRSRADAVVAASELVVTLDRLWHEAEAAGEDLVATVGCFSTDPATHGLTVVSGEVSFTVDARSHAMDTLDRFWSALGRAADEIAKRRGVIFEFAPLQSEPAVSMDPALRRIMADAAADLGIPAIDLPSGAGHDAGDFAAAGIPTAMVFIRSRHGSHNPAEDMALEDFAIAARLLRTVVGRLCEAP